MFDRENFEKEKNSTIGKMSRDEGVNAKAREFISISNNFLYGYQRTWMGLPIIQLPEDILVDQELFWRTKPDVIIETGVAWGGSVVFHASLMATRGHGKVIAVDKIIPRHIRDGIMGLPCSNYIKLIEGDSTSQCVNDEVENNLSYGENISLFLDSDHSHQHVLNELKMLSRFVTVGQYITVCATAIEWLPESNNGRPWGHAKNPMTAIREFMKENPEFVTDQDENDKSLISYNKFGKLLKTKESESGKL